MWPAGRGPHPRDPDAGLRDQREGHLASDRWPPAGARRRRERPPTSGAGLTSWRWGPWRPRARQAEANPSPVARIHRGSAWRPWTASPTGRKTLPIPASPRPIPDYRRSAEVGYTLPAAWFDRNPHETIDAHSRAESRPTRPATCEALP